MSGSLSWPPLVTSRVKMRANSSLRTRICFALILAGMLPFGRSAGAAVVIEHLGATNPDSEGFSSSGGMPGTADFTGKPNWRMGAGDASQFWRVVGDNPAQGGASRVGSFTPTSPIAQAYNGANGDTSRIEIILTQPTKRSVRSIPPTVSTFIKSSLMLRATRISQTT